MDLIADNIYLGNIIYAKDINNLKKEGITKILSVMDNNAPEYKEEDKINQKIIEVADLPVVNILKYIGDCLNFMEGKDKVLVHCTAGASRSACIVIAYIMWKDKKKYKDAFNLVVKKRSSVFPNYGFQEQLKKFEKILEDNEYNINKIDFKNIKWKAKSFYGW